MTPAQKKLRQLEDRLSRDRQRMAEIGLADDLTPETRAELDAIDKTRPDLERQLRAARVAVELEEGEQRQAAAEAGPDAELRERIELRSRASLVNYITAALRGRAPDGAEAELQAAAKVAHGGIPMELWDVPKPEQRADAPTAAPSTVGGEFGSDSAATVCRQRRAAPGRRDAEGRWRNLRDGDHLDGVERGAEGPGHRRRFDGRNADRHQCRA